MIYVFRNVLKSEDTGVLEYVSFRVISKEIWKREGRLSCNDILFYDFTSLLQSSPRCDIIVFSSFYN